jgi:hypothetical protein
MLRVTQLSGLLVALVAGYTLSPSARSGPQEVSREVAAGLYGGAPACQLQVLPNPTQLWCAEPITPTCGKIYANLGLGTTRNPAGTPVSCTDMCPDKYPPQHVACGTGP